MQRRTPIRLRAAYGISVMEAVMPVAETMKAVVVVMPEANKRYIGPEASVPAVVPMAVPVTMTITVTMSRQSD